MRRAWALAAIGLATTAVAACSRGHASAPAVADRVVSLGPATTEALFAIGAGPKVVGRSTFCDYPPEATKLPAVGGIEPDLEAIVQLHPDLVVGPSGAWSSRFAGLLAGRGISSFFPAEIATLAGVDDLLSSLGDRTGTRTGAEHVVAQVRAREDAVDRAVAGLPHPKVLFVVALTPVVAAGPAGFDGDMLKRAGAVNVVTEDAAWPALSLERIVGLDPDLVIDASSATPGEPSRITPQATGWSGVRAVREGHVVALHDERVLRPGPRVAEGLAALAHAIHPEVTP
jgi:iron complex transport system substrate-binding protein